jgi:hypothetical protein
MGVEDDDKHVTTGICPLQRALAPIIVETMYYCTAEVTTRDLVLVEALKELDLSGLQGNKSR